MGASRGLAPCIRGGNWRGKPPGLRSAARAGDHAEKPGPGLGFRVALGLPPSDPEGGPATKFAEDLSPLIKGATKTHAEIPEDATLFAGKHYKVFNRPLTSHRPGQNASDWAVI